MTWRVTAVVGALGLMVAMNCGLQPTEAKSQQLLHCSRLTAVDGDTVKCDGTNVRDMGSGSPFASGYDTPEIHHAKCDAELELGQKAKARMSQLLRSGVTVIDSGAVDRTQSHRPLVWIQLKDGRAVGDVLIAEGLARVWTPEYRADWCE